MQRKQRWKAKNSPLQKAYGQRAESGYDQRKLFDIQGECEEVRWYTDSEDGEGFLIKCSLMEMRMKYTNLK